MLYIKLFSFNGESIDRIAEIWNAFIKWAKMNFDVERTINIPHLGIII